MIFQRNDRYRGHLPLNLPSLYVCAECGGPLVHRYVNAETESVACSRDNRHVTFRSMISTTHVRVDLQVEEATRQAQEVRALARTEKRVKALVQQKLKKDNEDLFGK